MCPVKFDGIVARFFASHCRINEFLLDSLDIVFGHFLRYGFSRRNRHSTGSQIGPARQRRIGRSAGMMELGCNFTVIHMHGIRQFFHFRDMIFPGYPQIMNRWDTVYIIDSCILFDDHSYAAFGPFLVIADLPVRDDAMTVGQIGCHGDHYGPVFKMQWTNGSR